MTPSNRPRVLALVGATATGKTAFAERLALPLGAEIVCADSRQVFRELDAGTGKPSAAERATSPHHLFDALSLGDRASAGWYARAATGACRAILARNATPLLVGGSGLYLRAVMSGLSRGIPVDEAIRARLAGELERLGPAGLHMRLREVDPESACRLEPADTQRVTRALEVAESSGRPLSWWHAQASEPELDADWCVVELRLDPEVLSARIEARTRAMFDGGLIEETRALLEAGFETALSALHAVGYDEAIALLQGRLDRGAAEAQTALRTRQLAKRQRTWFRHQVSAAAFEAGANDARTLDVAVLRAFEAGAAAG